MNRKNFLTFIFILLNQFVFAETWNEPWQKEILQKADYFLLAKVISGDDASEPEVEITKSFGNDNLSGKLKISGYYMLELSSSSGHGVHSPLKTGQSYYLLLKKNEKGTYSLPTPTSGYADLNEGKVFATYRHSYHQALVPQEIYEKTYSEIWSYFKTSKYNESNISDFISTYLAKEPSGFDETEIDTFFLQHVALETAYLLDRKVELEQLTKFIESDNFHSRVSALQLLRNSKSVTAPDYLFKFITNKKNENFEKVIAIQSLWLIGSNEYQQKLVSIQGKLSDEETGFGGNIMDPRIATHFPSPRKAVEELKSK